MAVTFTDNPKNPHSPLRIGIAVGVVLMIGAYTFLVLSGNVSETRRIDTVHLVQARLPERKRLRWIQRSRSVDRPEPAR